MYEYYYINILMVRCNISHARDTGPVGSTYSGYTQQPALDIVPRYI